MAAAAVRAERISASDGGDAEELSRAAPDARQPDVLDDEIELRVVGRGLVNVARIEGILVQRPDRRPLVDVEVPDPQFLALLIERLDVVIVQAPAARAVVPLGGVELDALQ